MSYLIVKWNSFCKRFSRSETSPAVFCTTFDSVFAPIP